MQGRKTFYKRFKAIPIIVGIIILWAASFPQICYATLSSGAAFEGATWEKVLEVPRVHGGIGVVQSICCTENYIICLENSLDGTLDPDVVSAYYKNTVDENGNPVEQYSLAKQVNDTSYEHANGMAYNPNTKEILVSPYTAVNPENMGCLFIMDADTLAYKGKVKVSEDYNILGIDYKSDTDQYIIQTDGSNDYSFKILNSSYQVIEDLGAYEGTSKGSNFQDLCVDGDYIINFPLTLFLGIGNFINVYSMSQKTLVACNQLDFQFDSNVVADEPESICQTAPGEFMAVVNTTHADGEQLMCLYKTTVPYQFQVTASSENATISDSSNAVSRGTDYTVTYSPAEKHKLTSLLVDGKKVSLKENPKSYTFKNVQNNHTIQVTSEKISVIKAADKAKRAQEASSSPLNKVVIAFLCLFVLVGAFYIRLLHVRRLRALKRRRAKRHIQQQKYEL
ncbi:MAG: hypothetical protein RR678_06380 [Lachnospiraceae bacterium]